MIRYLAAGKSDRSHPHTNALRGTLNHAFVISLPTVITSCINLMGHCRGRLMNRASKTPTQNKRGVKMSSVAPNLSLLYVHFSRPMAAAGSCQRSASINILRPGRLMINILSSMAKGCNKSSLGAVFWFLCINKQH